MTLSTALLCVCADSSTAPVLTERPVGDRVAIVNVSLISMESSQVEAGRTIVVAGDRITDILPPGAAVPTDATVIDGTGKFLLPGLIDMHVHVRTADVPRYVQQGITSARNMWGTSVLLTHDRLPDGAFVYDVPSPAFYSASPGLDGPQVTWPETRVVASASEARLAVNELANQGWRWLKVYTQLSPEAYDAIRDAAAVRGIRLVGHVPLALTLHHVLASKQYSIEHLGGYERAMSGGTYATPGWVAADVALAPGLAVETRDAGTWNCPTSVVLDAIAARSGADTRRRAAASRHAMIRALHDAGALLIAGTDAGIDITAPGTSLHDELAEFVASGLSPYEALRAATRDAATFLERGDEIGTVAVGKRADLLLLDANPLVDIGNSRAIRGVMVRGRWFAR